MKCGIHTVWTGEYSCSIPAALSPAATPAPAATTHRVSPTAASTTGEGPVTSTDPDYWATPSFSTHCTRDPLNKYCFCWSAVVVIPNNPAAISFIGDPDEEHDTTSQQTEPTQQREGAAQHHTPAALHQQEHKQPTALLWTIGCTGGLTRLQPHRTSPCLSGQ